MIERKKEHHAFCSNNGSMTKKWAAIPSQDVTT